MSQSTTTSRTAFSTDGRETPSVTTEAASEDPGLSDHCPDDSDKADKHMKPLWDKFVKGIKAKKTNQNVVWDSMIKKLNRIKAYQTSTKQETMIADMFNAGAASESEDTALSDQDQGKDPPTPVKTQAPPPPSKKPAPTPATLHPLREKKESFRLNKPFRDDAPSEKKTKEVTQVEKKPKSEADKAEKAPKQPAKNITEERSEADEAFRKALEGSMSGIALAVKVARELQEDRKEKKRLKRKEEEDLAVMERRPSLNDPNRVQRIRLLGEKDLEDFEESVKFSRRYGSRPRGMESSDVDFGGWEDPKIKRKKQEQYFKKMTGMNGKQAGLDSDWKQKGGLGRYMRSDATDFDPEWLQGFGVVSARRRKSKSEDYKNPFKKLKNIRRVFKIEDDETKSRNRRKEFEKKWKVRESESSESEFGFSAGKRRRRDKSDEYHDPFSGSRSPKPHRFRGGSAKSGKFGRDRREPYDEMDYIFRKGPRNANSSINYNDFGIKKQKTKKSKGDEYFDPFGKIKKQKPYAMRGRSKTYPRGKSPRSGDDDYDEMDIIFRRKPRRVDDSIDYDFGVKSEKQRRSKPDQYVDPFRKAKKRSKSAATDSLSGYEAPSTAPGASTPWQQYGQALDQYGGPRRQITVVDEAAFTQYRNEMMGRSHRPKLVPSQQQVPPHPQHGGLPPPGSSTQEKPASDAASSSVGVTSVDKEKKLGKFGKKETAVKEADKKAKGAEEQDVSAIEIERDKKTDLLHIHVIGGFPTYSFHYSSFDKIHESISGAVADVEKLAEKEQQEINEPPPASKREIAKAASHPGYKFKPLVTQYYDVKPGPKKSEKFDAQKIPRGSRRKAKDLFLMELQDGSSAVFYPKSTAVAIASIAATQESPNRYVNCYDSEVERLPLAKFSPAGKSWCYDKRSGRKLSWNDDSIILRSKNGNVMYKWKWPEGNGKLKKPLNFQLNSEMGVRVQGKHDTVLNFKANEDAFTVPVGPATPDVLEENVTEFPTTNLLMRYITSLRAALAYENKIQQDPKMLLEAAKSKTGKRPSLVKDLKSSLVQAQPAEKKAVEEGTDEANKVVEQASEGWLAYKRRFLAGKGIPDKSGKKTKDGKPEAVGKSRGEKMKIPIQSVENEDEDRPKKEVYDPYQSKKYPSSQPKHMIAGPFAVTVTKGQPQPPHVRLDTKKIGLPADMRPNSAGSSSSSTPGQKLKPIKSDSAIPKRKFRAFLDVPPYPKLMHFEPPLRKAKSEKQIRKQGSSVGAPRPVLVCSLCPIVARKKLISIDKNEPMRRGGCPCSTQKIPIILDIEFDYFIHVVAPKTQMVVIYLTNSLYPDPYDNFMERIYVEKNIGRTVPCVQSRYDQFRILKYDFAIATFGTDRDTPLLLGRHNVLPGMSLIYCGGRLVFADIIFDGFGNTKGDFMRQVFISKHQHFKGFALPDDFWFTPLSGNTKGSRAGYGGQMLGAGVKGSGLPGVCFGNDISAKERKQLLRKVKEVAYIPGKRPSLISATSSASSFTPDTPVSKVLLSAKDFVNYSLSSRIYILLPTKNDKTPAKLRPKEERALPADNILAGSTSSLQRFLPNVPKLFVDTFSTANFKTYRSLKPVSSKLK